MSITRSILILTLALAPVATLPAQQPSPLDDAAIGETVKALADIIREHYVFEDKGDEIAKVLEGKLKDGAYRGQTDRGRLAGVLTRDVQSINNDLHLRVSVAPPRPTGPRPDPEEMRRRMLEDGQRRNFGFQKLEKLAGNVGYLDLRGFAPAEFGGPTAVAAMAFLQYSDAIIIDLRQNGGGSPSMIQLISTYFFERMTHLNSFFYRGQEQIDQFWTLPHVPGRKMADTPLFILTSRRTFSAAEEFTYNMKNLKRATIVGQTTGGGAHPGGTRRLPNGFSVFIPRGRAINPVTKTNWEGTGITPDIETDLEDALDVAHAKALETIAAEVEDPRRKRALEWAGAALQAKTNPVAVPLETARRYAGKYGPRVVTVDEAGKLWYARDGAQRRRLIALSGGLFMIEGVDYFRLSFVSEEGRIVAIKGEYDDGRGDLTERDG